MARVAVYVDGFNLYFGKLRHDPAVKWVDLEALARTLTPGHTLVKVRYFTAWVSGKVDANAPQRQQTYLRALRTLPLLETHFGQFKTHEKTRPLVHPPASGPTMAVVWQTEEKGSDVNLATWLLLDGIDGLYEEAVVVSNDSDLEEPIRQANARYGPVHLVSPHTLTKRPPYTHSYTLEKAAASYRSLLRSELEASQLPSVVKLSNGKTITRPTAYS